MHTVFERTCRRWVISGLVTLAITAILPVPASAQSPESVRVLREAAANGSAAAQYALGARAEQNGDMDEAFARYQQAALMGYAGAQYNLARLLETGKGVPTDYMAAEAWYRKAAEAKFEPAIARVQRLDAARRYERERASQAGGAPVSQSSATTAPVATASSAATPSGAAPAAAPVPWTQVGVYVLAALAIVGVFVTLPAFTGRRRTRRS